ncbi:MAG: hypothetical protein PF495_01685 [Spirochaetales bacterium]|jgi:hypothetical protein|nr:hypothetical protein [Spirochaetales bacterium]
MDDTITRLYDVAHRKQYPGQLKEVRHLTELIWNETHRAYNLTFWQKVKAFFKGENREGRA